MRGSVCFFFNDTATTEIYTYCTLSLHDARPIFAGRRQCRSLSVPQTVGHAVKLGHRVAGDERQQLRATEIELDVIFEAETIATERAHGMLHGLVDDMTGPPICHGHARRRPGIARRDRGNSAPCQQLRAVDPGRLIRRTDPVVERSEEHTSELQSLMRNS